MKRVRLPGTAGKTALIDPKATEGAVLGVNLRNPDGSLVTLEQLGAVAADAGATAADTKLTLLIPGALGDIDAAQATADAAQADATASLAQLADIAADGKLTADEKVRARREYQEVTGEEAGIVAQANGYGLTAERDAYVDAINALQSYLQGLGLIDAGHAWTSITGTTDIARATWDGHWRDVYAKRQALLNAIVAKAKSIGDTAQRSADGAVLVKDGDFENGGLGWSNLTGKDVSQGGGFYREVTSHAYRGTSVVTHAANGGAYQDCASDAFAVAPGDTVQAQAMARNFGGGANGDVYLRIWGYDAAGGFIGTIGDAHFNTATLITGSEWRGLTASGAVRDKRIAYARVGFAVSGRTAGYMMLDQVRAMRSQAATAGSANLVPCANFGGVNGHFAPWAIHYNPNGLPGVLRNKRIGLVSGSPWTIQGNAGVLEWHQGSTLYVNTTPAEVRCQEVIPVKPGQRYQAHLKICTHRTESGIAIAFFNRDGGWLGSATTRPCGTGGENASDHWPTNLPATRVFAPAINPGSAGVESGYDHTGVFVTAPADAAYAYFYIFKLGTQSGGDCYAWWIKPYFGEAGPHQTELTPWSDAPPLNADAIGNGVTFGVVRNDDLWDTYGARRIGMRIAGSGHRIGDNRNLPQIMVGNGRAKVATSITYTASAGAPATATISVGAFNVTAGYTLSYSASSVGVAGDGGTTITYHLYMDDAAHQGGARTLVATTNGLDVYASDGRIYIGTCQITFPTSGTGGGGGDRYDCVAFGMWFDADTAVEDARVGYLADCLDLPTQGLERFRRRLRAVRHSTMPCVRITTEGGRALVVSRCTPFDLPDGRTLFAPDLLGEVVVTDAGPGTPLRLERVADVVDVGERRVCRFDFGGCSFPAGEDPAGRIYSHNQTIKP